MIIEIHDDTNDISLLNWLEHRCEGDFLVDLFAVYFELESDALLFRLGFKND